METNHFRRNVVCVVLSVVVLIVFCVLAYNYKDKTSAEKSKLEAAVSEAKPYEDELTKLKRELSRAEDDLSDTGDTARFVIGYSVLSEEDIEYAEEQASGYDFSPVWVLDCVNDLIELENVALAASETGNEIMLTASVFTEEINETVKLLLSYMSENGIECSDIFLLRGDYFTDASIDMLISDGFIGYTVYNSTPTSGVTADGYVTFDYSYLTTDSSSYTRFSSSYASYASMIVTIDIASIKAGTLTEGYITTLLSTLSSYAENDDCEFSSVSDVVDGILTENESMDDRVAEYEAFAAECEERISELEEIVAEIYAGIE